MDKAYKPKNFENKIYKLWEKSKAFTPKASKKRKPFCIIMPPPNANAPLHIGHAMFVTLEDIMTRFHRMKGEATLWLPGADHAGILTQVVFEKKLAAKGKSRFDLGRKNFYKACLDFTQQNRFTMYDQIKKLGASCDWTREKFTLDKKISQQVLKTFVRLHKDGLAYRGKRMINWCPRCMTALSDLEVEYEEQKSPLWFIKYPLKTHSKITGQTMYLVVATTRPETMLGDTAVAVHHNDFRYKKFIGQQVILPIAEREIPIIADKAVDPEFGTGAVKVTPAHDPDDWQIAQKHKLDFIQVIGFDNKMTNNAGKAFEGLTAKEVREKLLKILQKKDFLLHTKKYTHNIAHCERCKTTIEPQVSLQWFVKTKPLAKKAIEAVKKKKIQIIPKRFRKTYFQWLENIRDWCVSRQLWWGHPLPIYYCGISGLSELQKSMNPELVSKFEIRNSKFEKNGCGHTIVTLTKPKKCPKCGNKNVIQDPDTFDAWFSSGQWPYTTLGFNASRLKAKVPTSPRLRGAGKNQKSKMNDFDYWYPTSVMETGYEILFFWVARMIMLGIYRTGKVPFETVYLHGLVRDAFGQKMSKSKGNVINPLDVIEKFGVDAFRMALVVGATPGNDISIGEEKIKGYRNFTNKVWNIGRFIVGNFKSTKKKIPFYNDSLKGLTKEDKLIIKKLNQLILNVTKNLEEYKFSLAGEQIYQFIWHEFADKYLECSKTRIKEKDKTVLSVLRYVYINCLKLLHPFMPFVTEAVWQKMPRKYKDPLISSSWPKTT